MGKFCSNCGSSLTSLKVKVGIASDSQLPLLSRASELKEVNGTISKLESVHETLNRVKQLGTVKGMKPSINRLQDSIADVITKLRKSLVH